MNKFFESVFNEAQLNEFGPSWSSKNYRKNHSGESMPEAYDKKIKVENLKDLGRVFFGSSIVQDPSVLYITPSCAYFLAELNYKIDLPFSNRSYELLDLFDWIVKKSKASDDYSPNGAWKLSGDIDKFTDQKRILAVVAPEDILQPIWDYMQKNFDDEPFPITGSQLESVIVDSDSDLPNLVNISDEEIAKVPSDYIA